MVTQPQNIPRVVITGVGVVSPVGIGKDAFWRNLIEGRTGIGVLKAFANDQLPCRLAAEIPDFNPLDHIQRKKLLKFMSRDIQLAVCAASLAMADARLKQGFVDPERLGVVFGAGRIPSTPQELINAVACCTVDGTFSFENFGEDSLRRISPLWLLPQLPNMPASHVAIENDARGPNNTITSREASALLALAEAVQTIQRGAADCMIVGGCGSDVTPGKFARMSLAENLSRLDDPDRACRPFDVDRDGCILGEGAAAFLVENYDFAHARGAEIYAEVLAVAGGCDGAGAENTANGMGLVRSINAVLKKSGISPQQIGHINGHGKSTLRSDLVEARAYHQSLGAAAQTIPVMGLKSYFGTFDAGTGAVELAASVLGLSRGVVPFTRNCDRPDPQCRLNVIHHEPLELENLVTLKVNRTDMGQSAAAIIRAV
ncbi:MAG: beta-ketoacyl-[acyl-carrier-protein] synthase family protein [Planctomycetes bacterium]|nr:beta-ketoacyl-[acyl-carrier-protein] synthase family protein [Planctomycetota bacterium]